MHETNTKVKLAEGVELDREEFDQYKFVVFVSNSVQPPMTPVDPEDVDPLDRSYLVVTVNVTDIIDTAPIFIRDGIISGGVSVGDDAGTVILPIQVYDPDLNDAVNFEISPITAQDPSLSSIVDPIKLITVDNGSSVVGERIATADLVLNFVPNLAMKGYFTFSVRAFDLGIECIGMTVSIIATRIGIVVINLFEFFKLMDYFFI